MEKAYFKNDLQDLLNSLQKNIFENFSFSKKIFIFVPSALTKEWILYKLASLKDKNIASFIHFVNISKFFKFFSNYFLKEGKFFPNYLELNLAIEKNIIDLVKENEFDKFDKKNLLFEFLKFNKKDLSFSEKRVSFIAKELTDLFLLYSIFNEKEKLTEKWQNDLFEKIFQKNWTFPVKEISSFKLDKKYDFQFHFFDIYFLPNIIQRFLQKLSFDTFYYIHSPCIYFWEDLCSDKDRKKILKFYSFKNRYSEKKIEEMDSYLRDNNPLLANLGKVLKEQVKKLNYEKLEIIEEYKNFKKDWLEKTKWKTSLLQAVKNDLLFLRNPEKTEKYTISEEKPSLQINETFSKLREIEVLFDFILKILSEENFSLNDILILAPDINEYLPYIHMVFKENEFNIDYKISDINNSRKSFFSKGIDDIFSLVNSRWEKKKIFDLFENPLFQKKHNLKEEEISLLKKWIDKAQISWGLDEKHKRKILNKNLKKSLNLYLNSWEYGFSLILNRFLFEEDPGKNSSSFFTENMNFKDIDLFEKFIKIFKELQKDIEFFEKDEKRSLQEWKEEIEIFISKNFFLKYEEEAAQIEAFNKFLSKLSLAQERLFDSNVKFKIIYEHLIRSLSFKTSSFGKNKYEAVHFCSLKNSIVSSKVICLIGMDEDFPRKEKVLSLNILEEYFPTKFDIDKYLFLKAILSSENFLYLSFSKKDINEKESFSSLLIQDFLAYINLAFNLKKPIVTIHPFLSFDKRYFAKHEKDLFSFQKKNYNGFKKYYFENKEKKDFSKSKIKKIKKNKIEKNKEILKNLHEDSFIEKERIKQDQASLKQIEIKDLFSLASNPIKFYFNKGLKIFLPKEKIFEKPLLFSFLEKYQIRQLFHKMPLKDILNNLEEKGSFPSGQMKEIAKKEIEEELYIYLENLKKFEIDKNDIFEVWLSSFFKKYKKEKEVLKAPSFTFFNEEENIQLIGTLKNISFQGLITYSELNFKNLVKLWPKILLFLKVKKESFLSKFKNSPSFLISCKTGKKLSLDSINEDEALKAYLEYYKRSLSTISFFYSDFAEALITKDEKFLEDKIKKTLEEKRGFLCPYLKKIFIEKRISSKEIFNTQAFFLKKTFNPLIEMINEKKK